MPQTQEVAARRTDRSAAIANMTTRKGQGTMRTHADPPEARGMDATHPRVA